MSFFDEVETTVANTRFLQAAEDDAPIKLSTTPFEQLGAFEASFKENINLKRALKPKTVAYHLFKKFLEANGKGHIVAALACVDIYRGSIRGNRREKARDSFDRLRALRPAAALEEAKEADSSRPLLSDELLPSEVINTELDKIAKLIQTDEQGGERLHGDLYDPLMTLVEERLKAEVWDRFIASPYYRRWIELEEYAKRPVQMKDFRVFRVLGRGAFGAVSAVQRIETHCIYAMKEMGKKQVKQNQSEWMCVNEMKVLTKMRSPFVLNLKYSFHDENSLYLVFDMCSGGDLKFHLNSMKDRCFPPERARFYAACVCLGLAHLHSFDIVYRDLKPDNILLNAQGYVKISDLGLTIKLRKNKTLKHLAGTAGYWAPEIVSKKGTYKASDWWGFAVFLYEMLGGRRPRCVCTPKTLEWSPFGQTSAMEDIALLPDSILKIAVEYPPEKYSPQVRDLLEKLFNPDPKVRLGAESVTEIQEHPYFSSVDWAKLEALELTPPFIPDSHTVNANSIAEVGEFNQGKWKKIKLGPEDEKHYEDPSNRVSFTYISEENIQMELVEALIKEEKNPLKPDIAANDSKNCCAIL